MKFKELSYSEKLTVAGFRALVDSLIDGATQFDADSGKIYSCYGHFPQRYTRIEDVIDQDPNEIIEWFNAMPVCGLFIKWDKLFGLKLENAKLERDEEGIKEQFIVRLMNQATLDTAIMFISGLLCGQWTVGVNSGTVEIDQPYLKSGGYVINKALVNAARDENVRLFIDELKEMTVTQEHMDWLRSRLGIE